MKPNTLSLIPFALLTYFAATVGAVVPAPDGGYPNGNTAEGQNALLSLTTGGYNTGVGFFALRNNMTNVLNTAVGAGALFANTADENTAVGGGALLSNMTGPFNTATGALALVSNTTGSDNTAVGSAALESNITGGENTAVGSAALIANTGSFNTAVGFAALFFNTTGSPNSAFGWGALKANTTGNYNTALGYAALYSNTTGSNNTAIGDGALYSNTDDSNTAVGTDALYSNSSGGLNTAIGYLAGSDVTGTGNVCIGSGVRGVAGEAWTIRIGDPNVISGCYIAGIHSADTNGGVAVFVDADGKLGTSASSRRFKRDIKPMGNASASILALKPVTFHYKNDAKNTPCFGLVAEEVAEVNPDLVGRDKEGKLYTVRYDQVNAMLLNEFLKEHKAFVEEQHKVEKQESRLQEQGAIIARQQKQIEALTAGLQKVSAQLELKKLAPQTVKNKE